MGSWVPGPPPPPFSPVLVAGAKSGSRIFTTPWLGKTDFSGFEFVRGACMHHCTPLSARRVRGVTMCIRYMYESRELCSVARYAGTESGGENDY